MRILVLLLLLLPPLRGKGKTYVLITGSKKTTWTEAQAYCRTHHTDLVTVRDVIENKDIKTGKGWIGLHRDDAQSPWKWSRGDEKADFTLWKDELPDPGNCVFKIGGDDGWKVHGCNEIHSFMCSDEKLFLVKENKTWEEALEHCRSLEKLDPNVETAPYQNYRYDLATLITPEDHAIATKEAQKTTTYMVWTGLRYLAGQWMWVSGEPVTYNTIPNCPGLKSCGGLQKDGAELFKIKECNMKKNFLCYRRR